MTGAPFTRRAILPLGLSLAVLLSCSDAPDAGMIAGPSRPAFQTSLAVEAEIDALIEQFLTGGHRTVAKARWTSVKRQSMKNQSGRQQHVQLADWLIRKSPEFVNVPAGETKEHAATRLVLLMSAYLYGVPLDEIPDISPATDATVGIVQPSQPDTVITPSENAAAVFPAGAVTEPTVIVVSRVDTFYTRRCSGPLDTPRCQYPEFYKFSAFPDQKFAQPVTVSVCHVNDGSYAPLADHDRFRLAHERPPVGNEIPGGTIEGNIEILPYVETDGLIACEEEHEYHPPTASTALGRASARLAFAARKAAGFFAPRPLYARRIDLGGGGELFDFSHVVTVDPLSGPELAPASTPTLSVAPATDVPRLASVMVSNWAVANTGTGTAGPSTVTIIMATDSALTNVVWTSGTSTIPYIDPSTTSPVGSFAVTIPGNTAPGTYFIGGRIDLANTVAEADESNNYVSARVTVRPYDAASLFCPAPASPPPAAAFPTYGDMRIAMANTQSGGTVLACDGVHVITDTIKVRKPLTFRSLTPGGATFADTYTGAAQNQGAMPIFFIDSVPNGLVRFADLGFSVQGNGIKAQFLYDSIQVDSSRFSGRTNETGIGIFIHHDADLTGGHTEVRASEFDMMSIGVFAVGNGITNVFSSNFDRFSGGGVVFSSSTAHGVVQNNVFTKCGSAGCIRILNAGNMLVKGNSLTMVDRPITLGAITVTLLFAGPHQPVVIEDNIITSAPTTLAPSGFLAANGIHFTSGAAGVTHVVRRNTITAAETGIRNVLDLTAHDNVVSNGRLAFHQGAPRVVSINRNDFTGLLQSFTTVTGGTYDYKCNWWGSTAGPSSPPTNVPTGTWQPFATTPIANQPSVACPPPVIL